MQGYSCRAWGLRGRRIFSLPICSNRVDHPELNEKGREVSSRPVVSAHSGSQRLGCDNPPGRSRMSRFSSGCGYHHPCCCRHSSGCSNRSNRPACRHAVRRAPRCPCRNWRIRPESSCARSGHSRHRCCSRCCGYCRSCCHHRSCCCRSYHRNRQTGVQPSWPLGNPGNE